jgi:hypothetical protein
MLIMKRKANPIAAMVQPLQGQPLPKDFYRSPAPAPGNYDQRNWDEVFKAPQWSAKLSADNIGNLVRGARLSSTASGI